MLSWRLELQCLEVQQRLRKGSRVANLKSGGQVNRTEPRHRVRLQTAQIFSERNLLLTGAQFFDRSAHGARLKLFKSMVLPRKIRLFDEAAKQTFDAAVAWQRDQEVGVRIISWSRT
jgi:hypothetical protein